MEENKIILNKNIIKLKGPVLGPKSSSKIPLDRTKIYLSFKNKSSKDNIIGLTQSNIFNNFKVFNKENKIVVHDFDLPYTDPYSFFDKIDIKTNIIGLINSNHYLFDTDSSNNYQLLYDIKKYRYSIDVKHLDLYNFYKAGFNSFQPNENIKFTITNNTSDALNKNFELYNNSVDYKNNANNIIGIDQELEYSSIIYKRLYAELGDMYFTYKATDKTTNTIIDGGNINILYLYGDYYPFVPTDKNNSIIILKNTIKLKGTFLGSEHPLPNNNNSDYKDKIYLCFKDTSNNGIIGLTQSNINNNCTMKNDKLLFHSYDVISQASPGNLPSFTENTKNYLLDNNDLSKYQILYNVIYPELNENNLGLLNISLQNYYHTSYNYPLDLYYHNNSLIRYYINNINSNYNFFIYKNQDNFDNKKAIKNGSDIYIDSPGELLHRIVNANSYLNYSYYVNSFNKIVDFGTIDILYLAEVKTQTYYIPFTLLEHSVVNYPLTVVNDIITNIPGISTNDISYQLIIASDYGTPIYHLESQSLTYKITHFVGDETLVYVFWVGNFIYEYVITFISMCDNRKCWPKAYPHILENRNNIGYLNSRKIQMSNQIKFRSITRAGKKKASKCQPINICKILPKNAF